MPLKPNAQFDISPSHSGLELAKYFKNNNRIHIPDFLTNKSAKLLSSEIAKIDDWIKSVGGNTNNYDYDYSQIMAQDKDALEKFDAAIHEIARYDFQYKFDSYRLSDKIDANNCNYPNLKSFYEFLNSPKFLIFLRNLLGTKEGIYCDAQVTRYRAGDFLTSHTDLHEKKGRIAAFVFNITPNWRADWGGLLQFFDKDGHVDEAFTPCFNALNVFKVPQDHSVSYVAPFAGGDRISITGWLRKNRD